MSHIINRSGAEADLFGSLSQRGIHCFSTIADMISFKRNYRHEVDAFKEKTAAEVKAEIESLADELVGLRSEYELRYAEQVELINNEIAEIIEKLSAESKRLGAKIKRYFFVKRLRRLETDFDLIVAKPLHELHEKINNTERRLSHLTSNREDVIARRATPFISETERTVATLTELAPLIYGTIGEQKAIELLRKLPDDYYVINDYRRSFHRPLHMKSEDDWIYSIQLDHVVVGPTGVFVIETKYWSPKSIANNDLFSPVRQLRRGGYALFVLLNNGIRRLGPFNHHWGATQISVGNILLMMNATTGEQFQFVKILTESNILDFITHRPTILSDEQVRCLVEEVL